MTSNLHINRKSVFSLLEIDSHMHSNVSPITDTYDNFAAADFKQSTDQLINGLIFPGDLNIKAEYNDGRLREHLIITIINLLSNLCFRLDVAQRLNVLEHMVNTGGLSPENLNLNITCEQQLADINAWLARLSGSIPDNYVPTTMDTYGQTTNIMATGDSYGVAPSSCASDLMLQSYNDMPQEASYPSESKLYPVSAEQDMYVRSHPVSASAPNDMIGYNATTPSNIYSDLTCTPGGYPPVDDSFSQFGYFGSQYQPMDASIPIAMDTDGITGVRHHYSVVPGLTSTSGFAPDVRTTVNYMSGNNRHKRTSKNPMDADVKKEDVGETVVPRRAQISSHEDKKTIATLSNVFASPSGEKPAKSETKKVETEPEAPKEKKRSSVKKDVMDLLVSDIESLNLQEKTDTAAADDGERKATLYPSTSLQKKKEEEKSPSATKSVAERHRELLQQLQKWVNDSYSRTKQVGDARASAAESSKPTHANTISVPVQ